MRSLQNSQGIEAQPRFLYSMEPDHSIVGDRVAAERWPGTLRIGAQKIRLSYGWTVALTLIVESRSSDPIRAKQLVPSAYGSAASARKELCRLRRLIESELPQLAGLIRSRLGADCGYWLDRDIQVRQRRVVE
jgi:hypothetical protein